MCYTRGKVTVQYEIGNLCNQMYILVSKSHEQMARMRKLVGTDWTKFRVIFFTLVSLCMSMVVLMIVYADLMSFSNKAEVDLEHASEIQQQHFRSPPRNTTVPIFVSGSSPTVNPIRARIRALPGFVYNMATFARKTSYANLVPADLDDLRETSPFHAPKNCSNRGFTNKPALLEFRNVWIDGEGNVLVPERTERNGEIVARHYSIGGGCCENDWKTAQHSAFKRATKCRRRVGFSLTQNHGGTPWHCLWEMLPRLLHFWNVALGVIRQGGVIVIPDWQVPENNLLSLGIQKRSIVRLSELCYFDRLLIPEPFTQGRYPPRECQHISVSNVLRDIFLSNVSPPKKPVVVLIDRAKTRLKGRCVGNRCIANLPELAKAIKAEFEDKVELEIFRANAKDILRTGARMFHRATVVYGMHGAGFTNIIYMRGRSTTALHLGWSGAWTLYSRVADMHGVTFRNIITNGAGQNSNNVMTDIPVAILEIRRALDRAGYQLPPPLMTTDPARNAQVVMRKWHYHNRSMT